MIIRDIAARKQVEQRLVESEKRLRDTLQDIPLVVFTIDMKGRVSLLGFVRVMKTITGYFLEEVLGHNWFDEFVPDTRPDVKEEFLRGLQTGGIVSHHENTVLTKMGRELFINFSNTILRDEQGNISGIKHRRGYYRAKKLQEALIQNENLLSESQRVAHIGSWKNELKGKSIWSVETFRLFGVSPETFNPTDENFYNLIHPDDRNGIHDWIETCLSGKGSCEFDCRIILPGGTIRFLNNHGKAFYDAYDKPLYLSGTIQDITERRKITEEKLKESQRYNRNLFETSTIGLGLCDMDGTFIDINQAFADIIGHTIEDALKLTYWEITPEKYKEQEKIQMELLFSTDHYGPYEKEYIKKNGDLVPVLLIGSLIERGGKKFIWSSVEDITKHKLAEMELGRSRMQLEQLYRHLDDIREEERLNISRKIISKLGWERPSPTALKIDLGRTRDKAGKDPEIYGNFNAMLRQLSEMIKNVQRISSELRLAILDDLGLAPAIEWYCDEFEKRTGVTCITDLDEIQGLNSKKSLAVFRILQEALTNVARHANSKNVEIILNYSGDSITLVVHDDGIGITKEKSESFNSLGMRGMQERVRQFNGRFEISGEKNKGTKLRVVIPVNDESSVSR